MKKRMIVILLVAALTAGMWPFAVSSADTGTPAEAAAKEAAVSEKAQPPKLDQPTLERLVQSIKMKIDIPETYTEFYSDVTNYDGRNLYSLRWNSKSGDYSKGGSIGITVDAFGSIYSFNHYTYYTQDYDYHRRLPQLSKAQAMEAARKFIYLVAPEIAGELVMNAQEQNYSAEYDGSYRFYFYRQHQNIPFYENGVSLLINGSSGTVTDFSRTWTEGIEFPDASKAMTASEAEKAYKESNGLVLKYRRTYGLDPDRTYLEYSPAAGNTSISALTGEKVLEGMKYGPYFEGTYQSGYYGSPYGMYQQSGVSEEELKQLMQSKDFLTEKSAEKLARQMPELGIDQDCVLNGTGYYKVDGTVPRYLVQLRFMKPISKDQLGSDIPPEKINVMIAAGEFARYAEVMLDAKTHEIVTFNAYGGIGKGGNYTRAAMQKAVEQFLKKYKAEKFANATLGTDMTYLGSYAMKYGMIGEGPNVFVYVRKVNGIPFQDNMMQITFDPNYGGINMYNEQWDTMEFQKPENTVGLERAYQELFRRNPLKLRYVAAQPDPIAAAAGKADASAGKVQLVYGTDYKIPAYIDASKGILVNASNGEPYRDPTTGRYKDMALNPAKEKVEALADAGILPVQENYRPNEAILQKDWIYLLAKVKGSYNSDNPTGELKQQEQDSLYRTMINEGVLQEEEKEPDRKLTREEAVKYLLNSIGYRKFAALKGLFTSDFQDQDQISPEAYGYVCIAKALGILESSEKYFRPKDGLTRAAAAVMLYNYMKQ